MKHLKGVMAAIGNVKIASDERDSKAKAVLSRLCASPSPSHHPRYF
jgi:hypothetical protein